MKLTPEHLAKHKDDKFRVSGRAKLSFVQRDELPAYNPDSVRTLGGGEAWQQAKRLLKNIIKGDTDALGEQFDQATKRGGYVMNKLDGGIIRNDNLMSPIIKPYPFNIRERYSGAYRPNGLYRPDQMDIFQQSKNKYKFGQ